MRKLKYFGILMLLVNFCFAQNIIHHKVDTFMTIIGMGGKLFNDIKKCDSCLLKMPIETNKILLSHSQYLLQMKNKQTTLYDSTVYPYEITTVNYDPEKKRGYLNILYIRGIDTSYQKGKFYLSDTIYKGYYVKENTSYKYFKLIKDSIWNIGHKGEYYTYKNNILHGKYQTYDTREGETGNYTNGYQVGLCQWFDSDKQRYMEDFYDESGNFLYGKQYRNSAKKLLQKETYLIINDKDNFNSDNSYSLKNLKWYFREYDNEGYLEHDGYKKWDKKKDDYIFYGIHKYYVKNGLTKIIHYDTNGNTLSTKQIK